jgi:chromosomal replication initiator protein
VAVNRGRGSGLQDRWTFDSFVSGPSNEFAHSVARTVASWADGHFNPVVIHGPYGFGKTHLLNAVAWEAQRREPGKTVMYMTSERFLSGFVRAVMDKNTAGFKDELRAADLLLIDDVHFIAGKPSSQEELLATLSALMEDGKRVVLASDRPPAALAEMEPRLRSHLQAGLVCGIEPACRTLRVGIIERKLQLLAAQRGMSSVKARPEVLQFVADRFSESVRELEGALNTLFARAEARLSSLSLDEAQAILRPHLKGAERRVTVDEIQKLVAEHFGLKQADLLSERRTRAVARPRQIAMHLAKSLTTKSYPDIGRRFGGRDHTTVLHAVRTIERMIGEDPAMARDVETLARKLRG